MEIKSRQPIDLIDYNKKREGKEIIKRKLNER